MPEVLCEVYELQARRNRRAEISNLIVALGARSRFQAGCLLVRRYG